MKYFFLLLAWSTLVSSFSFPGRFLLSRDHGHHHFGPPGSEDESNHHRGPPNHEADDHGQSHPTPQNITSTVLVTATPSLLQDAPTRMVTVTPSSTQDTSTRMVGATLSSAQDVTSRTSSIASAFTTIFVVTAPTESPSPSQVAAVAAAAAASSASSSNTSATSDRLSQKAQLGIGVGVSLGAVSVAAAGIMTYIIMRKRRRRTDDDTLSSGSKAWPAAPNLPDVNDSGKASAINPTEFGPRDIYHDAVVPPGCKHFKSEDSPPRLPIATFTWKGQQEPSSTSTVPQLQEKYVSPKQLYEMGPSSPDTSHSVYELDASVEIAEISSASAKT